MARVYVHQLLDVADRADRPADQAAGSRRRRFGTFQIVGATARWPQALALWEHDSWGDLAHDLADLDHAGTGHGLDGDHEPGAVPAAAGTGRILVAHPDSPGVQDWRARGGTGAVAYLHEVIDGPPASAAEICDTVVSDGAEDHRRFGLELVGAWRTALRADDQVVALWAVPSWDAWVDYEVAADGADVEFFRLWERLSNLVAGRRRTLLVDAPGSPLRADLSAGALRASG